MSLTNDYLAARKRLRENTRPQSDDSLTDEFLAARNAYGKRSPTPNFRKRKRTVEEDDIGPVDRTWFQGGAFEDGYDFGDILKTYSGTIKDATSNVFAGAAGILENTIDTGATALSLLPWWKDELSEFVANDLINEEKIGNVASTWSLPGLIDFALRASEGESIADVLLGSGYEENSLLGERSDSLAQSAGQLALQAGLQTVGVPWKVTSSVSSFGSEAEQAFDEGANPLEATLSGAFSAGVEIITEKMFDGISFGDKTLTDGLKTLLTRKINDKVWKGLANFGIDLVGESAEEVLSEIGSRLGQWATYQDDKTFKEMFLSEEAFDAYMESAVGGAVLGGGKSFIDVETNILSGRDPISGLTDNETRVVKDLYEARVAEAETDGEISEADKNKIWDETIEQMDRGEIDIKDIERILGGDTYNTYKETVDSEDAIWDEFNTLNRMKQGDMTGEQMDRRNELKGMIEELDKSTTRADLAKQLSKETYNTVQGTRLVESYNEKARRGQAFEADVTKYDKKQQKTIQDAIDSGILNNTRKTHEFVDWVAKVAGDKGINFEFTNNVRLEESPYAIRSEDGSVKLPNGYRDKSRNVIGINTNSRKNVNVVAGHEITHVLEGSEFYQALQDSVFRYAVAKEGQANFDKRLKAVEDLYKGVTEDAKGELTADLVGEYLFTDRDFIKRLSTENRNLFQKVYDEIKYMWRMATAGSREKRELERVKKAFEDAYRDTGKDSKKDSNKSESMDTEVQHSLSHDSEYMVNAIAKNDDLGIVESEVLEEAKAVRERIAQRMNEIKDKGLVGLPEDIAGNTYIANSSYDGTEENTTICPRSLASEAFVDAVSEYLGRPLTVEEQIYISQDLQGRTLTPECIYCYVATDRKAYRAFLGEYINQRDSVIEKLKANPDADVSRNGELYKEFLNGRKDTKPMYNRFKMWVDAYRNGKPMVQASHLANINKLMGDIKEFGDELKPQIVDAMKYAQSASWAKKRIGYVAYNGHILKWKQDRINKLNSHYGLRMYSFSDFHPAFVLENMQMITDASVRGLKMLGYTKDTDFVEIFAPTGMNINISTFGFESGGQVFENNLTGAAWDKAKELREQHPNVGITFVATNDTLVNWALDQDWIDVVIPYHLVRTGEAVAKAMKYTNYTSESSDTKTKDWKKGDKKYIAPTEHNNDKATYLAALERNHLRPRFERFLDNPNYMKLVNECRQPASQSQAVQPIFNEEAANEALAKLEANGYYQPIGGSVDRMYEIAGEVAEAMTQDLSPTQYSLSEDSDGRQLSEDQIAYFKDSKVRDENGNLKVMYHGSTDAGFHVFDPGYSDDGISLFFVDSQDLAASYSGSDEIYDAKSINTAEDLEKFFADIGAEGFEVIEENGRLSLYHYGDFIVETDDARGIYTEFCDYAGVGEGEANYRVYLNLKNPLVVDAHNNSWRELPPLADPENAGGKHLWKTRDYAQYAKENGYDGVIFKNIEDIGGYGVVGDTVATVAIAFDSNQIKSVANQNPTTDPDIRYSLSDDSGYSDVTELRDDIRRVSSRVFDLEFEMRSALNRNNGYEDDYVKDLKSRATDAKEKLLEIGENVLDHIDVYSLADLHRLELPFKLRRGFSDKAKSVEEFRVALESKLDSLRQEIGTRFAEEKKAMPKEDRLLFKALEYLAYRSGQPFASNETSENVENSVEEDWFLDTDLPFSLSGDTEAPITQGNYHVTGKDIALDIPFSLEEDIAPVSPGATWKAPTVGKDSRFIPSPKKQDGLMTWAKEHLLDNGMVFEDLAKKAKNRELEAKWNFIRNAPSAAQNLIGDGDKANGVKALKSIIDEVDKSGKTDSFNDYLLHFHNFDRMSLESRFPGSFNKPVFGDRVTAEESMKRVEALEKANPEFKSWAREVYDYNDFLRNKLVDAGIITQETSELWSEMYPHYVPVYRDGEDGFSINEVPNLGVNAPVKRATGGNGKILNVLDAMASRTLQTFKAVAKNNFGVELMHTLGSVVEHNESHMDEFTGSFDMDTMFSQSNGIPTYTVYQDGERATFEITSEMYEAMKPKQGITQKKIPVLSHINSIFRGLTTQYNPVFALTNPIKDIQEVLLNSQHPGKTYLNIPNAIWQMGTNGKYYQEYLSNGGKTNTYFDDETKTFKEEPKAKQFLDKVFAFNDYIEMTPRLAEYIVSRESGRSIETSMLDAARVTTNFSAGGDVTKFLNRNGATFLNASVQGAIQQVRNVREAHQKGLMGYVGLATRCAIGGLVPVILNNLMWDDDEDYEDLADYVKQGYYVIGKTGDGKFLRIPKGRTLAVLQEAMDIVIDTATGDDEVDLARYLALGTLAIENLAPNNPMDNNIFAPIKQVVENKTWYGEQLVPSRLADLPAAEQYDEKTDSISKWLGETFNLSPYKINYLLNQYSGGIGDFFLPMLTPRAESGDDSFLGTITAPFRDKFTTDSVLNSQTVSDFYDTCDELEVRANAKDATEEDVFKYMYMRSISFDTSDLYAQKREIQSSDLPDSEKYEMVREIQAEINALMEEALGSYENPHIDGLYAEVGSKRYNLDVESGNWYEIKAKNADGSDNWYYQMEQEVTKGLGISYGEYWNNREEYNFAYQKPGKYAISQAVGGYETYQGYSDALYDIHADKDKNGKSISGSRKTKVIDYVNGLDCDYGMKIILFKSEYPADDTYNYDIIDYLNDRDDISYEEMETILKELGFNVDANGNVTW